MKAARSLFGYEPSAASPVHTGAPPSRFNIMSPPSHPIVDAEGNTFPLSEAVGPARNWAVVFIHMGAAIQKVSRFGWCDPRTYPSSHTSCGGIRSPYQDSAPTTNNREALNTAFSFRDSPPNPPSKFSLPQISECARTLQACRNHEGF